MNPLVEWEGCANTERGCVEDQPQRVVRKKRNRSPALLGTTGLLRLVLHTQPRSGAVSEYVCKPIEGDCSFTRQKH